MKTDTPRLDAVMKELGFERPNESYVYVRDEQSSNTDYPYRIVFPILTKDWIVIETYFDNHLVLPENLKKFISTTVHAVFAIHRVKTSNVKNMIAMLTADYYLSENDKAKHEHWVKEYEQLSGKIYKR